MPLITDLEQPEVKKSRPALASMDEDYTGQSAVAFAFKGERYEVHTWKEIALILFQLLWKLDAEKFKEAAGAIRGRKRPYFTQDKSKLRQPELIPNANLFFETNLSANYMIKLCYTVLEQMGLDLSTLVIEAEL